MSNISIRKIIITDKSFFARWWRDEELIKLTSGVIKPISDQEVNEYFSSMLKQNNDHHFIITADSDVIGHISLSKRQYNWYEIQIAIGEKQYWGKGYGTEAINLVINKAKTINIIKLFLLVRPTNERAIKAYEKCGFKYIKEIAQPNNKYLPTLLRMEHIIY